MRVDQFDFELPSSAIALRPSVPRDSARMLVVHSDGRIEHRYVRDLPDYLTSDDVVVANDSKVIAARLSGCRQSRSGAAGDGPKVEVTLHKRTGSHSFLAFAKPLRKIQAEDILVLGQSLVARVEDRKEDGSILLVFSQGGAELDAAILGEGEMPLPPYIASKRKPDRQDREDYQTIFARQEGSVAAPTAGLHFTQNLRNKLVGLGVGVEHITLHVGAGTFLPVKTEDTDDHRMHGEVGELSLYTANRLNRCKESGGRIVAVGTTSLRTLERAVDNTGKFRSFGDEITLFITPGYRFRAVDLLLTNFHLPRSTLFMLVSAFCGLERMKRIYAKAICDGYRFYSYGDACLLFRNNA